MQSGIYKITCLLNDHFYIGQTQNFKERKKDHFKDLRKGNHSNRRLQNCFNKYGAESFEFSVLKECPIEWLERYENLYLDQYFDHPNCMNMVKDSGKIYRGRRLSLRKSLSQRREMSKRMLEFWKTHKMPENQKENISKKSARHYTLINPEGTLIEVFNLLKFCKDNNLKIKGMRKMVQGYRQSYYGWKLREHIKTEFKPTTLRPWVPIIQPRLRFLKIHPIISNKYQ